MFSLWRKQKVIDATRLNARIDELDKDMGSVTQSIQECDAKKNELMTLLRTLDGARQQCQEFLKELDMERSEGKPKTKK